VRAIEQESDTDKGCEPKRITALKGKHPDGLAGYLNHVDDKDIIKYLDNIDLKDVKEKDKTGRKSRALKKLRRIS
jgi:hypothetical protein